MYILNVLNTTEHLTMVTAVGFVLCVFFTFFQKEKKKGGKEKGRGGEGRKSSKEASTAHEDYQRKQDYLKTMNSLPPRYTLCRIHLLLF